MDRLREWIDEGRVDTVIVAGVDLQGRMYGKRCTAKSFIRDLSESVHTCDCNFGWDIEKMLIPGLEFTGWHKGYGDMTLVPDKATLRLYPWFEKTALVLCDTYDHHGKLVSVAPRTILRRQLEHAASLGYSVMAAPEIEFFLFKETVDSSRDKDYRDLKVMSRFISDYDIYRSSLDEWIVSQMRRNFEAAGIEIEGNKAEWGHGQFEINMVYAEALEMADRHVIFKNGVREMAALNGIQATFMAKWDSTHSGNGCHLHMSLWKGDKPSFYDPKAERHVSDTMRYFLGGNMALAKDLQLFYAPTINSYKRYEDLSFAPTLLTWGGDNRTTAFRVAGEVKSMRLENRIPGADCNAHLTYAAMIGAGLYGIENKIEPIGPYIQDNAYVLPDPPKLNRTLREAADSLESSIAARKILGDDVVDHYVGVARWEIKEFDRYVTDWERRRYFELI